MISPVATKEHNMAGDIRHEAADTQITQKRDRHFHELLDMASAGKAEAIHDLWLEYQYDFAKEGRGND
jgi:hypothetical protein